MNPKATVGIAESLLALLRDPQEAVTHIAVAFDNPVPQYTLHFGQSDGLIGEHPGRPS
jgi:hypothetical protein